MQTSAKAVHYIPHPKRLDILSDVQKFAQCARSLAKVNGAIEFLDHKNIGLDIKIILQMDRRADRMPGVTEAMAFTDSYKHMECLGGMTLQFFSE